MSILSRYKFPSEPIFWAIIILLGIITALTSCTKEMPVKSEIQPKVGIRISTEYIDGHIENSAVVF